jgi:membrane protease YdiL (CAAX protease family)
MTAFLPLLFIVVAACIVVQYDRRRRRGDDPLGPPPTGELPDTRVALLLGFALWAVLTVVVGTILARSGASRGGGAEVLAATVPNVIVSVALLRIAMGGTRTATLPTRRIVVAGEYGGLVALGASSAIGLAIESVYSLRGVETPTQLIARHAADAQGLATLAYALAAVVLAPFSEEVFFRGILLPALARTLGERTGLAVQALLFGVVHVVVDWSTWPFAIPLAVVGWCAGWIYLRTGSLAAPLALHMTFNAIGFTLLRAFPDAAQ